MMALLITCDMCGAPALAALDEVGDTYCDRCLARQDAENHGYRAAALEAFDRTIDLMEFAKFSHDEIYEALEIRLGEGSDSLEGSTLASTPAMEAERAARKERRDAEVRDTGEGY